MIFKKLFSPSYKSKDPETRIASLAKLDKNIEKDKAILHELAFNDDSEKVSLAALDKLDSFALWMKASETSNSQRTKKKAEQTCMQMLEDPTKVNGKLFSAYVTESKSKHMQEELLFNSKRLQQDSKLSLSILMSLHNDNLIRRFFQEVADEQQQSAIIDSIDNAKTLNRFVKHVKSKGVEQLIEEKLIRLQEAKEKPIKIKQQATLINSRLLALKDATDYEFLKQELEKLNKQFETLKSDFSSLDDISSASLTEKYLGLKVSLRQRLADLEEGYNAKKQLSATTNAISDIAQRCDEIKLQIDLLISQDDSDKDIDAQSKILGASLQDALAELEQLDTSAQTAAHRQQIKNLHGTINQLQQQVAQASEVLEYSQKAKALIASLESEISVYSEADSLNFESFTQLTEVVEQHKRDFNDLKKRADGLLVHSIVTQFASVIKQCTNIRQQFLSEIKKIENRCESKLKAVQNMIAQGRFKPALSTFHKVQVQYDAINAMASKRLQKLFDSAKDEVIKLKEWQAYIAQPRKPELIQEVKVLLSSEFQDPYERTEQVKQLRQQWNSLGKLYTQEDDEHNKEFDELIEKAFHPCRVFFTEIDKLREENYQKALKLIEKADAINTSVDANILSKTVNGLKREFSKLGEIDRDKKNKIKRDFNKALKPANERLSENQKQNADEKQKLVKQANNLVDSLQDEDDVVEAVNSAKQLQQRWKQIGFAGKPDDNDLWQAFREANDKLFSKYHDKQSAERTALTSQLKSIEDEISNCLGKIDKAKSLSELQFYNEQHEKIISDFQSLDTNSRKKLSSTLTNLENKYDACITRLNNHKQAQAIVSLFECLKVYTSSELPDGIEDLPSSYKSWFKEDQRHAKILENLDRTQLLQVAAILQDKPHSEVKVGTEKSRKELQLTLMASKLEGNEVLYPEMVLAAWISLGPLTKKDLTLLEALEPLYLENRDK